MPFLNPSTSTITATAGQKVGTISGLDLTMVTPGMVISFGSRTKIVEQYQIAAVSPTGTTGGTITTFDDLPALNNAAFVIDTTGFTGTDATYLIQSYLTLLNTLNTLLSPNTNLYSGSRQIAFDKSVATALSRLMFSTAGRTWADLAHRTLTYTPTGGQQTSAEILGLRAFLDGTTATDALMVDLTTGGVDARRAWITMAAATTVDLSSVPAARVLITGSSGNITSFGTGKNLDRLVRFQDGGVVLKHNATTLALPGNADITTRANDCLLFSSNAAGNGLVAVYQRGDGTAVNGPTNVATLDPSTGKLLAAQIPDALLGSIRYQGGWNAATNSPALPAPAAANKGWYYIVLTAGSTSLPGPSGAITDWQVGDWAVSDGTYWEKVDSSDQVISVAGLQGAITAAALKTALALAIADVSGLQTALDARLRFDAAQTLSAAQKTQGQTNLGIPNGAMTPYTSVLTSNNGTITSYQLVVSKYQMVNTKLCFVVVDFVVNNAGSANAQVPFFTLPFTASGTFYSGAGRNQSSGFPVVVNAVLNDNKAFMTKPDNTGPIENGARFTANILYEVA